MLDNMFGLAKLMRIILFTNGSQCAGYEKAVSAGVAVILA